MDKQSRTISVKVNGTEANYEEKKKEKEEFDWMVVESETTQNVVPFQKHKLPSIRQQRKKWSNIFIFTATTAIIIGTVLGMGMLHLLTGQGAVREATVTSGEKNNGAEQKEVTAEEKKAEKPKVGNSAALEPITLYFVQGGLYSSEEKGQAAIQEWKDNGSVAAIKPNDDKYSLVVGISSNEQSIDQLVGKYKKDGVSVLKKKWEITDQALLKDDKEVGLLLSKLQPLYMHFVKYLAGIEVGNKSNSKEVATLEQEWKAIEKEGKSIKREDVKKVYTYASVTMQTIKEGKTDKETVAKLNQVIIDGLLSYEKIVSQKAKE
ncbi:stage II sporulation protein B [Bacillus sp. Xin]|uniref:stage II sporulation protein B n=1 Tax=unclassified Bacillus (in: firmicutes) TaxID=185979 RepID=UPI001572A716|nr:MULTISPECIES: stage II sporulation protein B [unclassified Bacillus (in: firmicutes)]MBC6974654.1 stage II sporulation protein B [Bacillus sp. Xin]NSW34560.1 stage II sporulation protein B [Bacillus sp. Xin1]